ncbi:hypothetical protein [Nostoc sp.]
MLLSTFNPPPSGRGVETPVLIDRIVFFAKFILSTRLHLGGVLKLLTPRPPRFVVHGYFQPASI